MLNQFIDKLQVVATSPYAFVAYVLLIAAWAYIVISRARLKRIASSLEKLPKKERAPLLAREYSTFPKSGLTAEQWLKSRRQQLLFWAFISVIIALILLGTLTVVSKHELTVEKTAVTDWQMYLYLNGVQLNQGDVEELRTCNDSLGNSIEFQPIEVKAGQPFNIVLGLRLIVDNVFRTHQDLIYPIGLSTTWTPEKVHTIYDGMDVQVSREYNGVKFQRDFFPQLTINAPTSKGKQYIIVLSGATLNANQLFYCSTKMKDNTYSIWRQEFKKFEDSECYGYLEHVLVHPGNRIENVNYSLIAIPLNVI